MLPWRRKKMVILKQGEKGFLYRMSHVWRDVPTNTPPPSFSLPSLPHENKMPQKHDSDTKSLKTRPKRAWKSIGRLRKFVACSVYKLGLFENVGPVNLSLRTRDPLNWYLILVRKTNRSIMSARKASRWPPQHTMIAYTSFTYDPPTLLFEMPYSNST